MVSRPGNPFSGRNSNSLGGRARNSVGQDPLAMREAAQIAPIVPATNSRNTMIGDPSSKNKQAPVYAPGHGPPSSGSTSGAPPRGPPVTNPDNGLTREDNTVSTDGQSGVDVGRSEVINRPPPSTDQMYEDALRKLLESGPRDTAEEEALLREQMQRDVGSGQANLNARMAAGGMGTSGALSALGTDMRSRAAFDAANSIQGLRGDARDEWSRNVQAGLGAVNQDRTLDVNEAKFQAYIDALNGMQDDTGPPKPGDGVSTDPNDPGRPAREGETSADLEAQYEKAPEAFLQWPGDKEVANIVIDGVSYGVFKNASGGFYRVKSWYQNKYDPKNQEA